VGAGRNCLARRAMPACFLDRTDITESLHVTLLSLSKISGSFDARADIF
jgi:hypothetical protein